MEGHLDDALALNDLTYVGRFRIEQCALRQDFDGFVDAANLQAQIQPRRLSDFSRVSFTRAVAKPLALASTL
jgi:hypothetical protein